MKRLMHKVFLILLVVMSAYAYGFTEEQPGPGRQPVLESKTFKGKVDSIILPGSANEARREIVVTDDQGGKMNFVLTSGIGVYTKDWEVLSLKKIKPGDRVAVEYTTNKTGMDRAISIIVEQKL